jgi:HSP20 family protein
MASKSFRDADRAAQEANEAQDSDFLLEGKKFLDPFAVGSWTPNVDICQTPDAIVVQAELPGIDASDVSVSFEGENLRIQGVKREPAQSQKLLCYYCLERRYGKIDRNIRIGWVVNPKKARAHMESGILTIVLPKINDRRGNTVEIQIKGK